MACVIILELLLKHNVASSIVNEQQLVKKETQNVSSFSLANSYKVSRQNKSALTNS